MEDQFSLLRDRTNTVLDPIENSARKDEQVMMKNAMSQLTEINSTFDDNYSKITELLGLIADNAVATHSERTERITELQHDLTQWIKRAEEAKKQSDNVESLVEKQRYVQQMESERQDLIQEILAGTEETERLKRSNEEFKEKMDHLQHLAASLKKKKDEEIPTYLFLRKIFRQVSETKIVTSDSDVLEGFVSKSERKEVLPFRYDRTKPTFERVNDLWNKISN